jgi:hypothetical protein
MGANCLRPEALEELQDNNPAYQAMLMCLNAMEFAGQSHEQTQAEDVVHDEIVDHESVDELTVLDKDRML